MKLVGTTDNSMRGLRDRALLLVAYDTLCRRSELLCMRVADFKRELPRAPKQKPAATIFLRRSKTDPEAQGRWLSTSRDATRAVEKWLKDGPLFRGVARNGRLTDHLDPGQIARIYKKAARAANLPDDQVRNISGHSMRVGAAQNLLLSGASLPLIMHRSRWSKSDTVMRYVERVGIAI